MSGVTRVSARGQIGRLVMILSTSDKESDSTINRKATRPRTGPPARIFFALTSSSARASVGKIVCSMNARAISGCQWRTLFNMVQLDEKKHMRLLQSCLSFRFSLLPLLRTVRNHDYARSWPRGQYDGFARQHGGKVTTVRSVREQILCKPVECQTNAA